MSERETQIDERERDPDKCFTAMSDKPRQVLLGLRLSSHNLHNISVAPPLMSERERHGKMLLRLSLFSLYGPLVGGFCNLGLLGFI